MINMNTTWKVFSTLAVASIFANLISIYIGIAWGNGGYIEKLNWSLNPIFFLVIGLLVNLTWELYLDAWNSLPTNSLLYKDGLVEKEKNSLYPLINELSKIRGYLIFISVVLGLAFTSIDAGCLWSEYGVLSSEEKCKERDFSVAFSVPTVFVEVDKVINGLFVLFVYFLQGAIIAAGFLVFFQVLVNGFVFWRFEKTKLATSKGYNLRLNHKDPLGEFGLSEINRALNTVYVVIAIGMVIPVLSAAFQENEQPDLGQLLIRTLVPFLLLVPLIIPLIDRYFRIKEASIRVSVSEDKEDAKLFKEQKLWPFEGTQIGYIGKVAAIIAFAEYLYIFTGDLAKLVESVKSII